MSFSEFTQRDYEVIARNYAELKEAARKRCSGEQELAVVQKAFDFANEAHKNVRRRSGEPYILHPIAVAKIVLNYHHGIAALRQLLQNFHKLLHIGEMKTRSRLVQDVYGLAGAANSASSIRNISVPYS